MKHAESMKALLDARSEVVRLRIQTQFKLPLADQKLIRVTNYLDMQAAEIEKAMWEESGLLEPEVTP
jgi:hypothetical protein